MTLKFECELADCGSEATYLRLVAHIEQRSVAAAGGPLKGRHGIFGAVQGSARSNEDQAATILRSGLFDPDLYLATYKDVAAIGADPLLHYIESGDEEGRWPNAFFDPNFYRKQFAAVGRWPFSTLHHYVTVGEAAGLRPSAAFDRDRYLSGNAGLGPWIERPLAHFLWVGRHHGLSPMRSVRRAADQRITISRSSLPEAVSPTGLRRAVNVIGPLDRVAGVGVSVRGYLEAIEMSGFGPVGTRVQRREFTAQAPMGGSAKFESFIPDAAVNLVHMGADTLPLMLESGGGAALAGRYNIAVWYWELPTLRPEWRDAMDLFHAFWAPSEFVARAIRQLTSKPVRLVPPYLSYLQTLRPEPPADGAPPRFVYCFDANSVIERKNPGLLLDAFLESFPDGSDAQLTFKVTYPNRRLPELERLYAAAASRANVEIIDTVLPDAELHRLIASATAYVSPHRSEGLGLTVIEAMACGVPVIATPFGGIAPFVTPETAWPLDFDLTELAEDHAPYPRGYVWAEPSRASMIAALRSAVADPEVARKRSIAARAQVLNRFASPALIRSVRTELESAASSIGLST